jgi:hypothetical protein
MPLESVQPPVQDRMYLTEDMFRNGEALYAPGGIKIWDGGEPNSSEEAKQADPQQVNRAHELALQNGNAMVITRDMFQPGVVLNAPGGRVIWPLQLSIR